MKEVKGSRYNKDKRKWSLVHYKSLEPHIGHIMCNAMFYRFFDAQEPKHCACTAPLVRGYGDEEYCGLCQKRFLR